MKSYLKVKVGTLAAESKVIKVQMRRWRRNARRARAKDRDPTFAETNYYGLRGHLVGEHGVQKEARATNLAYGFLCNRPYRFMELFAYTKPNWAAIESMVNRFTKDETADNRDVMQRFSAWKDEAVAYAENATESHRIAREAQAAVRPPHRPGTRHPDVVGSR